MELLQQGPAHRGIEADGRYGLHASAPIDNRGERRPLNHLSDHPAV